MCKLMADETEMILYRILYSRAPRTRCKQRVNRLLTAATIGGSVRWREGAERLRWNYERRAPPDPRWRTGDPPLSVDTDAVETCRAARWQVSIDRHSDQQLPPRGLETDLRADAVQFGIA